MLPSRSRGKPWQGWCSAKTWLPAGKCITACGESSEPNCSAVRPASAGYRLRIFCRSNVFAGQRPGSAASVMGSTQRGPDRRMVGRPFALARGAVDAGRRALFGARPREQDVIDPQALVFLKAEHPVIPPREGLFRLVEEPEAVFQAQAAQALESGALGFGDQNAACPDQRVMNVAVVGGDVVVAAQGQTGMRRQFFFQPLGQGVEPAQLVVVFVAADSLTVRHVGADDAGVADRAGDQPFLLVGEARIAADDVA